MPGLTVGLPGGATTIVVMKTAEPEKQNRNLSLLSAQGGLINTGWNMASPAVVLTYIAITQDVPVFLAALLVAVRRVAFVAVDLFGGAFIEAQRHRPGSLAAVDVMLAVCLAMAIISVLLGSPLIISVTLVAIMFALGIVTELRSVLFADFIGRTMSSEGRKRIRYWGMALGGFGTILLVWPIHMLMVDANPAVRHSTIVLIGTVCFLASAAIIIIVRRNTETGTPSDETPKAPRHGLDLKELLSSYRTLIDEPWFRRFLMVRLPLLSVELALPFFAILAAVSNEHSARGVTALIMSTALALAVAGPLWGMLGRASHRVVMAVACVLAAVAGLATVGNHLLQVINPTLFHAAAVFVLTVATRGVASAHSLYFLDVAPDDMRVVGMTMSRTLVRLVAIGLSVVLAAVAHMQHVVWAILAMAVVNLVAAAVVFALALPTEAKPQST